MLFIVICSIYFFSTFAACFFTCNTVEILSTVDKIWRVVGSSDQARVHEALISMKETQSVLVALAAIVAAALHNNCGHINEDMKSFVELIQLESNQSARR
jgi:hypothetical protein